MPPKKRKALLEDEEDEVAEPVTISVNKEYAARFEHNKKREELHRLQEKHPEVAARLQAKALAQQTRPRSTTGQAGGKEAAEPEQEDSDSEEEDEGYVPEQVENQILETIARIRQKDPAIYDPTQRFFPEPSASEEGEEQAEAGEGAAGSGTKHSKPLYLRQVLAQQALEGGAGSEEEEDAAEDGRPKRKQLPVYDDEQKELRQAFLQAADAADGKVEGDDDFGGVLKKRRTLEASAAEGPLSHRTQELLDKVFGQDDKLSREDQFLKSFIRNQAWIGEADEDGGVEDDDVAAADEEDEQYLEQAERFEAEYNFRYQEPGAAQIVTHPRQIDGSVRRPDDRRKRQRAEKAARREAEEEQRRMEVKRLKNLKRREIADKLAAVRDVAGSGAPDEGVLDTLMEGDFDPDEYDRRMAAAFGNDYYNASDDEAEALEAEAERALARATAEDAGDEGAGDQEQADEGPTAEEVAAGRAEVQRMLEDYYKLDYEGSAGGLKTRFRYKQVPAADYGLAVEDVLRLGDAELNQILGLRRLVAYREDGGLVRPNVGKMRQLGLKARAPAQGATRDKTLGQLGFTRDRRGGGAAGGSDQRPVKKRRLDGRSGGDRQQARTQGAQQRPAGSGPVGLRQRSDAQAQPEDARSPAQPQPLQGKRGEHQAQAAGKQPSWQHKGTKQGLSAEQLAEKQKAERLQSYARPQLKKQTAADGQLPSKKEAKQGQQPAANSQLQGLTKAQKKNLKRTLRKAAHRAAGDQG